MKYLSLERPISLGTYPKPKDNKVLSINNYNEKKKCYVKTANGVETVYAWGSIEYEKPLWQGDVKAYELKEIVG